MRHLVGVLSIAALLAAAGCSSGDPQAATTSPARPPVVGATGTVTQGTAGGVKPAAGMSGAAPMRNPNSPGLDTVAGAKSH